jgi:hypothetical protein
MRSGQQAEGGSSHLPLVRPFPVASAYAAPPRLNSPPPPPASRCLPTPPPRRASENITDGGLIVLLEACAGLRVLWLGGKLLKVTDSTAAAAARYCAGSLVRVKLTRSATAASLLALRACRGLKELDARHCREDPDDALLASLLSACPNLTRLVLPPGPEAEEAPGDASPREGCGAASPGRAVSGGGGSSSAASGAGDEEEEEEAAAQQGGTGAAGVAAAPGCSLSILRRGRLLGEGDMRRLLQGLGSIQGH